MKFKLFFSLSVEVIYQIIYYALLGKSGKNVIQRVMKSQHIRITCRKLKQLQNSHVVHMTTYWINNFCLQK